MNKYNQLTEEKRIRLDVLLKERKSIIQIAIILSVHRSTIYRELKRNAQRRGGYRSSYAHMLATERKERFARKRRLTPKVKKTIEEKLNLEWSPEQIAGYCTTNNIDMVSHESIYKFIYQNKREGGTLYTKLRHVSKPYRRRLKTNDHRGKIPDRVSIEQRPDIVLQKQRYGDWEVDTIIGKRHRGAILTIVERKSYFTLLAKLDEKKAEPTSHKIINLLAPYKLLVHTITSDNGHEFTNHTYIAQKLQADFYFTHPYSAWEKAINENTNGLIRQYIPKASNFKKLSIEQLKMIEWKLNNRPRKSLNWNSPLKVFMANFTQPQSVALGT